MDRGAGHEAPPSTPCKSGVATSSWLLEKERIKYIKHASGEGRTFKTLWASQIDPDRKENQNQYHKSWVGRNGKWTWEDKKDEYDLNTLYKTLKELKDKNCI